MVRVQFTLAYGADIGGASAMGGSLPGGGQTPSAYYDVADKDALTAQIAAARASGRMGEAAVSAAYKEAVRTAATLNIGQGRWIRPQPSLPPLCRAAMGRQRTPRHSHNGTYGDNGRQPAVIFHRRYGSASGMAGDRLPPGAGPLPRRERGNHVR